MSTGLLGINLLVVGCESHRDKLIFSNKNNLESFMMIFRN